jgi:two-component system response regulator RegA
MTTVLLVEDDPVFRSALARSLRRSGHDVAEAGSVEEAAAVGAQLRPDLAVVDLKLQDGSGVDVIRELARVVPTCRSILLTGHGTIPAAVEAMRAGAVDVRTKPISTAELKEALERAVEAEDPELPEPLDQAEREHILRILNETGGNISAAARRLGLHRRTLQRKLQKLPPPR